MGQGWIRRALLVEDQPFMRMLVGETLRARGFDVQTAARADEALRLVQEFDPDVLITDIELGSRPDGIELATIARATAPHLGVVFLTNFPRALTEDRRSPVRESVHVDKATLASTDDLLEAVEQALLGKRAGAVERERTDGGDHDAVLSLTRHQREVLSLVSAGLSNAEIADRTDATQRAVERTISRIFDHLDIAGEPSVNPRVVAANRYNRVFGPYAT